MVKFALAILLSACGLLAAGSALSQGQPRPPAAMTLEELRNETLADLGLLHAVQREILRRHPTARPFDGYDPAQARVGAETARRIGGYTDDQLVEAMATAAARIEALSDEGTRRLAQRSAPLPAPPPPPRQSPAPASALEGRKAYCKTMYGKAYMLCGREDRSCKFLAASHWQECEKTGQWRD